MITTTTIPIMMSKIMPMIRIFVKSGPGGSGASEPFPIHLVDKRNLS